MDVDLSSGYPVDHIQVAAFIAFAALATACGCPAERIDELWGYAQPRNLPTSPGDAVRQMNAYLAEIGVTPGSAV
jgi:hypothetical protein